MDDDLETGRSRSEDVRAFTKSWRAWRTASQMIQDRGYELTDDEVNISLDRFMVEYRDPSTGGPDISKMRLTARPSAAMIEQHSDIPTAANPNPSAPNVGTLWIEFNGDANVGIKQLKAFAHYIAENNYTTGILVTQVTITPSALKIIPTVLPSVIETFLEQDLLVNISHHELVPKHIPLSKAEKQALLQRYRLKESQLPRIQVGDPMARYLGLRRGQVVKIIRKSETAGRYASYRWAI